MTFEQWCKANGYDYGAISSPENATQRKHLEAAWKAETQPANTPVATLVAPAATAGASSYNERMRAIEEEAKRQTYIREATARAAENYRHDPDKVGQLRELCEAACKDDKVDARTYDLSLIRFDRAMPPINMAHRGEGSMNATLLEAAVCLSHGLKNPEKYFSEQTLQTAHSSFRRGLGLKELLQIAAEKNDGYRGSSRDEHALCRSAFRKPVHGYERGYGGMRADVGISTIDVTGILGNVANKFLVASFMYTEQAWREISRVTTANDFKQMTTYRLTGANKFEKVPAGGEIKHGTLGELSYTNQVDTYGKMLGIDRRDIINDDLGALTNATQDLARGAGDSLNEVFWTEFLNDSTFFPTDKSKLNYDDGATDSVLSLAGLENADSIFASQTKPDGTPLGVMPAILLVPRGLRSTALTLMSATGLAGGGNATALVPNGNPWAGMFRVVSSIYLASTAISGYSATAWYLLADPANIATMQVAFLNGRETPVVETGEFDFDRLGVAMRAYMDWGVSKMEYRAGVKLKGAA